uniref:Uncharacterized protein n=1 Tax=Opuntia streptacantha TaxID=393608 RepID=A0A7C8YFQ4_OPUST
MLIHYFSNFPRLCAAIFSNFQSSKTGPSPSSSRCLAPLFRRPWAATSTLRRRSNLQPVLVRRQTPCHCLPSLLPLLALFRLTAEHADSAVCLAGLAAARVATGRRFISATVPPPMAIISAFKVLLACFNGVWEGEP